MLPVLVLCGGRGTRIASITGGELPKALVPVADRPFIDHKLLELAAVGLNEVVLSVGVGGDQLRSHVGDGSRFGVEVRYVDDGDALLGTGGAAAAALPQLADVFWLTYGDTLLDVDVAAAEAALHRSQRSALMTVLHNQDEWGRSNTRVEADEVVAYRKRPSPPGAEHIDYGMLVLPRDAFAGGDWGERFDLEAVIQALVAKRDVTAFTATHRFYDIGTPEALAATDSYLRRAT